MKSAEEHWRLLDTGVGSATDNIAIDATLLDLRAAGLTPNTVRLLAFEPAAALIGRHQTPSRELRLDFCRANGIDVNRRLTGGGAILLDQGQIGWEVIAGRRDIDGAGTFARLTGIICEAACAGLRELGIPASFRARNDIEVGGRKISGSGGAWEGEAFLFQGTLLVDFDVAMMLRALRVPTEKLSRHDIESAADRVISIAECLDQTPAVSEIKAALVAGFERSLGISLEPDELTPAEIEGAETRMDWYGSSEWFLDVDEDRGGPEQFTAIHVAEGGTVRTSVDFDHVHRRIRSVIFSGDYFFDPARAVFDLESRLRSCDIDKAREVIDAFFAESSPDAMGLEPEDFHAGIAAAASILEYPRLGLTLDEAASISIVGDGAPGLQEALNDVGALLLPYCAKLPGCEFRDREGCDACGDCTVGDAMERAALAGLQVFTIQDYDHLEEVFLRLRRDGVGAYIGCCCQAFLVKRHRAFRDAGMTGVIIDIDDETCYDLGREEDAYAGSFDGATTLKTGVIGKLLDQLPAPRRHGRDMTGTIPGCEL